MNVRAAEPGETGVLARLWHDGWQDAHAAIVPAALVRARTLESFAARVGTALGDMHVIGPVGAPLGLCMLKGNELYQLFVAAKARGAGIAAVLISDAEKRLAESGVETAWLDCAIGNERAARFYEKSGWRRSGVVVSHLETPSGPFELEVWRYEKRLVSEGPG